MIKRLYKDGFSLLEVLLAIFILSFGLLGIAGLYINSLKRTENAYRHTLATLQLVAMIEEQKVFVQNSSDWNIECQRLLPHGVCKYEAGKATASWRGKYKNLCYEIEAQNSK